MDHAHLLLLLLFALTIGHLVTLKLCSVKMDHRTAPLFISFWTLLGLGIVYPFYGHLLFDGIDKITASPWIALLIAAKGALLYLLFIVSQKLMRVSLSSRHYVTPLAVGVMSIVNFFLGEELSGSQWFAALGLCALAMTFFFKGHLSDLDRQGRFSYAQLVIMSVTLSAMDLVLTKNANWYTLLFFSNIVLLTLSLAVNIGRRDVIKAAFTNKSAMLAGVFYVVIELTKFYQQVDINPVTVVVTVQAMTKPVILILSAIIWKERTVREQMIWGVLAFAVTLPLFWGK